MAMFESVFSLFAKQRLALSAQSTGYILAYVGVLVAAIQGGGMGVLTKRFPGGRTCPLCADHIDPVLYWMGSFTECRDSADRFTAIVAIQRDSQHVAPLESVQGGSGQ